MTPELEIVLPRRVAPQPSPAIVKGGDCGACCLAALTGLSVRAAYGLLSDDLLSAKPEALTWHDAVGALRAALRRELVNDVVETVPLWLGDLRPAHMLWGATGAVQSHGWVDYLRLAFGAGFYAMTAIDHAARGPFEAGDHWVLLCGLRRRWVPVDNEVGRRVGARSLEIEVLVSSSAAGGSETWIGAGALLRTRGGFAVLLARPR